MVELIQGRRSGIQRECVSKGLEQYKIESGGGPRRSSAIACAPSLGRFILAWLYVRTCASCCVVVLSVHTPGMIQHLLYIYTRKIVWVLILVLESHAIKKKTKQITIARRCPLARSVHLGPSRRRSRTAALGDTAVRSVCTCTYCCVVLPCTYVPGISYGTAPIYNLYQV